MTLLKGKYPDKNLTEFYICLPSDKNAQSESYAQGHHQQL